MSCCEVKGCVEVCMCVCVCGRPDIVASVLVDVISSKQMYVYLRAYVPLSMYIYTEI